MLILLNPQSIPAVLTKVFINQPAGSTDYILYPSGWSTCDSLIRNTRYEFYATATFSDGSTKLISYSTPGARWRQGMGSFSQGLYTTPSYLTHDGVYITFTSGGITLPEVGCSFIVY